MRSTLHRPIEWLRRPHSAKVEVALAAVLYALYEGGRGLVAHSFGLARHHATLVVGAEKSVHVFWERGIQQAVLPLHWLVATLGAAYMTLHLGATVVLLIWVYRRHRDVFPLVRNSLIVATSLALVVHVAFPTAPPRLVGITTDTVTRNTHVNLNSHLLGALYNPIAAMPSLHFGYAVLISVALVKLGRSLLIRLAGLVYPLVILFVIVATGNHYFLDALAGAAVMAAGIGAALLVSRAPRADVVRAPYRAPRTPRRPRPELRRDRLTAPRSGCVSLGRR